MDFSIAHEFDCDPARYWSVFFDEDYNRGLYLKLDTKERTVVERRDENGGETIHRVIRIVPKTDADAGSFIQKFVGGEVAYLERSTFQRAQNSIDVRVELDVPVARDRFDMRGVYTLTPLGPGRVRREFRATVKVAIPFLGGQAEKKVAEAIRRNYEVTTEFTRVWLATHG